MNKKGKYITRITPNYNRWLTPSGIDGKCCSKTNPKLYEWEAGFGWEEWLFNSRNRKDDYQYGFLECFNKQNFNDEVIHDEVVLYSRICSSKNSSYRIIAVIRNLIKLSNDEATIRNREIVQNGDKAEMRKECKSAGGDLKKFDEGPAFVVNIKFRYDDILWFDSELKNNITISRLPSYKFILCSLEKETPVNLAIKETLKQLKL